MLFKLTSSNLFAVFSILGGLIEEGEEYFIGIGYGEAETMELWIVKVICLILTFVITFICCIAPLKIIPKDPTKLGSKKSRRIMSLSNCFSGGVFLATYFIGLAPVVRKKFREVFTEKEIWFNYPLADLLIAMGFFMVLISEQITLKFQERGNKLQDSLQLLPINEDEADLVNHNRKDDHTLIDSDDDNELKSLTHGTPHDHEYGGHGHGHSHGGHGHSHFPIGGNNSYIRCIVLLLALSIHSVFEGLALGLQDNLYKVMNLFIAVIIHEVLVSFALGVSLAKQDTRRANIILVAFLFCAMIPLGMVIGIGLGEVQGFAGQITSAVLQALAAGTFIYVIFFETLPGEMENSQDRIWKSLAVFIGFIIVACVRLLGLFHKD